MPVLYVADDWEDFDIFAGAGGVANSTSGTHVDTNFSRVAFGDDAFTTYTTPAFTAASELWLHYNWFDSNGGFSTSSNGMIEFKNNTTNGIRMQKIGAVPTYRIDVFESGVWVAKGVTFNIADNVLNTIDFHVKIDATIGQVQIYVNEVLAFDFTGKVLPDILTDFNKVRVQADGTSGLFSYYSEFIVADEDTRGWRVIELYPTGAGNDSDWTGASTEIDDLTSLSDSDAIESNTPNDVSTFAFSDTPAAAVGSEIVGVFTYIDVERESGSPVTQLDLVTRPLTTNYFIDVGGLTEGATEKVRVDQLTNPETSAAWTLAELDASQFGVRART